MAFFTQNKFNYTTGVPDGNDVYPSVSSTWGDDGAGVLGNGTIAFPTAAGGAGQVLTDVGGTGVLTFADAPSTPPSGILGSVQLSDGAGGFTSDQPSFNYNSTTKRLGVGKVATTSLDVLEDSIGVNAFFENVSGSDFDTAVGLKLKHRTTIDMEATFGIAQEFYLEDDTSGELLAGSVGFERVDSDSERRYVVKGGTNGTQELFSIDSNREFTVEKGLRNGFGVDSLSGVSDDALAWNINDANAAAIIANAGSGIGLRVIANSGNILSLEDTNEVAQVLVSNTGLVTFNAAANATGDFEVLAETTGTNFYSEVSTGNSAFGTTSPNVFGSSGTVVTLEHPTNHGTLEFSYKGSDTGTVLIGDIFGVSNNISGINGLATQITFRQDGITVGNRGGKVSLLAKQDGLSLFHSLDFGSDGILRAPRGAVFNGDFSTGDDGDVTINKTTSGVLAYFDTSSDDIGFGTGSPNVFGNAGTVITIEHPTLHNTIEYSYKGVDSPTQLIGQIIAISGDITGDSGLAGSIAIRHSGTTDGNRGGSIEFTTKGDAALPVNTMSFDHTGHLEIPGAVTANTSASATGNFEVLAETTGTALLVDVSTGDVGIGTTTVNRGDFGARALTLLGTTAGGGLIEIAKDTGDSDGAGIGGLEFNHSLASGNNGRVGLIGCNLSGSTAGNRGSKIAIRTKANGSSTYNINFTIDHDRTFDFAGGGVFNSARIDQNFDFKKTSSGTAFFIDTATTDVGIGTDTPNIAGFGRVLTIVEAADTNNARIELHKNTSDSDGAGLGSYEWTHALVSGANSRVAFVSTRLSGGTAGNRGGELDFGTKANGSSTLSTHLTIDNTGKTVLNASASATGDVEILQSGGGQLALFDAGTGEIFLNLPTSAGTTGSLYNDSGTVKVA